MRLIAWWFLSGCFLTTLGTETAVSQNKKTKTQKGALTSRGAWIPDRVQDMPGMKLGPFVRLGDGSILTIDGTNCYVSKDQGKTWSEHPLFAEPDKYEIRPERALLRTRSGVIILAFANDKERANWDWQKEISDSPGAILPTYAVRSLDDGRTWETPQKLHNDWTGAIRDMIETRDGNVVFTSMMMQHNPGHHAVVTYTTKNDGESWQQSNVIDLGGIGHHAGVTEATLEQLRDGRLWLLMRTNWGRLWEAYSDDEGVTWKYFRPTAIEASSAPALLKRLNSGRLVLIWNRPFPEGKNDYPLRGGDGVWSEVPASNHRSEISIKFSDDDGKTWTDPVVIARCTDQMKSLKLVGGGNDISYPYLFEAAPGELWITIWRGEQRIKLNEKDFL